MNDTDYFLEITFSPSLINIKVRLAMNLGAAYLVTEASSKRLGK